MWYTYIILCSDGSFYTGSTNDVEKRFKDHVEGRGARYTKSHKPVSIVFKQAYPSKVEAMKGEWQIKKMTRKTKEALVKGQA